MDAVHVNNLTKEYVSYSIKGFVPMTGFPLYSLFTKLGLVLGSYKRTVVKALNNVSFRVKAGEIFGILGPNGSGKTTLLKILSGITMPTSGEAQIYGLDVVENHDKLPSVVMYIPGLSFVTLFARPEFTVLWNLEQFAELAQISSSKVRNVISMVGLEEVADKRVLELSTGQLARLSIAFGLMRDVKVYLMDEPFTGISPETRKRLFKLIKDLSRKENITILYATHILDEAQELCNRVMILHKGKIIAMGTPRELIARFRLKESIDIDVKLSESVNTFLKALEGLEGIEEGFVRKYPGESHQYLSLTLICSESRSIIPRLVDLIVSRGNKVIYVKVREPSLEDIYLSAVGGWEEPLSLEERTCFIVSG